METVQRYWSFIRDVDILPRPHRSLAACMYIDIKGDAQYTTSCLYFCPHRAASRQEDRQERDQREEESCAGLPDQHQSVALLCLVSGRVTTGGEVESRAKTWAQTVGVYRAPPFVCAVIALRSSPVSTRRVLSCRPRLRVPWGTPTGSLRAPAEEVTRGKLGPQLTAQGAKKSRRHALETSAAPRGPARQPLHTACWRPACCLFLLPLGPSPSYQIRPSTPDSDTMVTGYRSRQRNNLVQGLVLGDGATGTVIQCRPGRAHEEYTGRTYRLSRDACTCPVPGERSTK